MVDVRDIKILFNRVLSKDRIALSKAITLIESSQPRDFRLARSFMQLVQTHRKPVVKIGVTGTPGVGKSTFINNYAKKISPDLQIAILTVDPSSSFTGGSLLGDKTRMPDIVDLSNVFIRPSPSKGILGGISLHTWETVQICEAAGFDIILIETVGTGQSEIEVKYLADEILFLVQPGSGDELQGIKKGILEIADKIIVTKTDIDPNLALSTLQYIKNALHTTLYKNSDNLRAYYQISDKDPESIESIIQDLKTVPPGKLDRNWEFWFEKHSHQLLINFFQNHPGFQNEVKRLKENIKEGEISHFTAIEILQNTLKNIC